MKSPLTVLVICIDAIGRVEACRGATRALLDRGHRVIFFIEASFKGKLAAYGFQEILRENNYDATEENPCDTLSRRLLEVGLIGPLEPKKKFEILVEYFLLNPTAKLLAQRVNRDIEKAIEQCKPDLVWLDHAYLPAALYYSNIPWIRCYSANPLFYLMDDDLPPGGSGYPTDGSNRDEWPSFNQVRRELCDKSKAYNDYIEELGYKRFPDDLIMPTAPNELLTVYAFPNELNYAKVQEKGWFNLEVFNKHTNDANEVLLKDLIPADFLKDRLDGRYSGKLIYLSLGSMGSVDIELMKRLTGVLSTTNHKYIVSKGPRHEEYSLPKNMWGERFLAQTKIVPFVDLVITHGGNNTLTETFAIGKPMIVLPIFNDQFDNGQRLSETGFGVRLDPYRFENQELIDAVNKLLYDDQLHDKLSAAAARIQSSNSHVKLCELIEQLMSEWRNKSA